MEIWQVAVAVLGAAFVLRAVVVVRRRRRARARYLDQSQRSAAASGNEAPVWRRRGACGGGDADGPPVID